MEINMNNKNLLYISTKIHFPCIPDKTNTVFVASPNKNPATITQIDPNIHYMGRPNKTVKLPAIKKNPVTITPMDPKMDEIFDEGSVNKAKQAVVCTSSIASKKRGMGRNALSPKSRPK